jgi:hypothetical protein
LTLVPKGGPRVFPGTAQRSSGEGADRKLQCLRYYRLPPWIRTPHPSPHLKKHASINLGRTQHPPHRTSHPNNGRTSPSYIKTHTGLGEPGSPRVPPAS